MWLLISKKCAWRQSNVKQLTPQTWIVPADSVLLNAAIASHTIGTKKHYLLMNNGMRVYRNSYQIVLIPEHCCLYVKIPHRYVTVAFFCTLLQALEADFYMYALIGSSTTKPYKPRHFIQVNPNWIVGRLAMYHTASNRLHILICTALWCSFRLRASLSNWMFHW